MWNDLPIHRVPGPRQLVSFSCGKSAAVSITVQEAGGRIFRTISGPQLVKSV